MNKEKSRNKKGRPTGAFLTAGVIVIALLGVAGYWLLSRPAAPVVEVKMASPSQLTDRIRSAAQVVQEAYLFAIANPEPLSQIPCYCGCGEEGHKSNLACYVKEFKPDGSIEFDDHAFT